MRSWVQIVVVTMLGLATGVSVAAQGGVTSSLSGIVQDESGGALPGATIVVQSHATGSSLTTVSNEAGVFSVPSLGPGVYGFTISLQGFKSRVVSDLTVSLGSPASVRAVLVVGGVNETVEVSGASASLINTQTPTVSATLMGDQINRMPMTSRNLVNAVAAIARCGLGRHRHATSIDQRPA